MLRTEKPSVLRKCKPCSSFIRPGGWGETRPNLFVRTGVAGGTETTTNLFLENKKQKKLKKVTTIFLRKKKEQAQVGR